MSKAEDVLQAVKDAVEKHEPTHGMTQWFVDNIGIDCDADEFWGVVESVLREKMS
jgi:hypothetical protein